MKNYKGDEMNCIHWVKDACELKEDLPGFREEDIATCDIHLIGFCSLYEEG